MRQPEQFNLRYFNWTMYPHTVSGILWADGRSRNPGVKLGRYSLATTEREAALGNLHDLDLKLAIQFGRARPDQLRKDDVSELLLRAGREAYDRYNARAEVAGGVVESTLKRYRSPLNKFIAFAESKRITTWARVNKALIHDYADWLEANDYAYSTEYTELTIILQTINCLIDELELLPASCRVRFRMRAPDDTTTYCYTEEEVRAIIEYCVERPNLHWLGHIVIIFSHTGMRIGELRGARWHDIDQQPGMWTIPFRGRRGTRDERRAGRSNKSQRPRDIPIVPKVREVLDTLRRQKHADDLVVHGPRGGAIDEDTVREVLVRDVLTPLSKRFPAKPGEEGLIDGRLHSFRHYFCSACANQGRPEFAVADWLGHAGSRIVKRYYHLKNDQSLRLAEGLSFVRE